MGLFSSKKKIVVGTQLVRMIDDKNMPDSVRVAVSRAIFKDLNISEEVVEDLLHSIGSKAERMYEWAASGKYVHGMPSGNLRSITKSKTLITDILQAQLGGTVSLDYVRLGPANLVHRGWMILVSQYGYNSQTNELEVLSAERGHPVYLFDMVPVVPKSEIDNYLPGVLDTWGLSPNAGYTPSRSIGITTTPGSDVLSILREPSVPIASKDATQEVLKITIAYERQKQEVFGEAILPIGSEKREEFEISQDALNENGEFFQVKYLHNGKANWWIYEASTGVYPELDAEALQPFTSSGTFFPFAYFRYNKVSEPDNPNKDEYRSAKDLIRQLGINFDKIVDAIDENPDIADVESALMIMGVPPDTKDPLERRYLFSFFSNLYDQQDSEYQTRSKPLDQLVKRNGGTTDGWNNAVIDIADKRFKMRLIARGMYKKFVPGNIGKPGSFDSGKGVYKEEREYHVPMDGEYVTHFEDIDYYYYRKQITEGLYEEIQVYGLESQYWVYQQHRTSSDETENILLIPLDRSITRHYTISQREVLYSRALHFVFNSMKVIKVRWYQRGLFRIILVIVALTVTYFISGADGGSLVAAVMAAGVSSVTVAIIISAIISLAVSAVLGEVFKIVAKAIGGDFAIILSVIAAVAAVYLVIDAGSVTGAPWAQELLSVSNNLAQAGLEAKMDDLLDQWKDFIGWQEESLAELERASDLLNNSIRINPMIVVGESPTDFYNRTVHAGNVGTLGFGAISSYVEIALQLPKVNDAVGETMYV